MGDDGCLLLSWYRLIGGLRRPSDVLFACLLACLLGLGWVGLGWVGLVGCFFVVLNPEVAKLLAFHPVCSSHVVLFFFSGPSDLSSMVAIQQPKTDTGTSRGR